MPLRPSIPLATRVPRLGAIAQNFGRDIRDIRAGEAAAARDEKLFDLKERQVRVLEGEAESKALTERDERRLTSVAIFSKDVLKPAIESGKIENVTRALADRIATLDADPNQDSTETREALKLAVTDPDQLLNAANQSVEQARLRKLIPEAQETFEAILDKNGNVIGQRSSTTGKVVSDPRTPSAKSAADSFETLFDDKGNIVAQRNTRTGKVLSDPRAPTASAETAQFEPVRDDEGNIIAQKNVRTGKVVSDPRAASGSAQFEPVLDKNGNIVGQRNVVTNEVKSDPRTVKDRGPQTEISRIREDVRTGRMQPREGGVQIRKILEEDEKSPSFQKGSKYLVDGGVIQGRFNPATGENEVPDGQGGFRPVTPQDTLLTSSTDLEIGPDGTIRFKTGLGDNTIATQTGLEREQIQAEELVLEARKLFQDITSADVGVRGVFGDVVIDRTIGQLFNSVVNKDRQANRQSLGALREKGLRLMTTDSRFNLADRAAVEKLFPKDGIIESLPAAKTRIDGFVELVSDRISFAAGKLGRKSFVDMNPNEIKEAVNAGTLDADTAFRALKLFHGFSD